MAATLTAQGELTFVSFPIIKTETTADGDLVVYGKATDGSVDSDEQIVDPAFSIKAIKDWLDSGPNIRVQHNAQRDPAGVGIDMDTDAEGATWVKSLVIEPVAKQLVAKGALRAYSVGIARPSIVRDAVARGGRIVGGEIVEISLVDRPANKNCGIQLVKADSQGHPELVGKVFGSSDVLTKYVTADEAGLVNLQIPADVQLSFSPADMAKMLARKGISAVKNGKDDDDDDDDDDDCDMGKAETGVLGKGHRKFSAEQRRRHAAQGNALPDGSYPIPDADALRRAAILARSKHGNWKAARRLIARRARELGVPNPLKGGASKGMGVHPAFGGEGDSEDQRPLAEARPDMTKKKKVICPSCGAKQSRKHVFCTECGRALTGTVSVGKNHDYVCLGCGHELDKGEEFCPQCGKKNPGYLPEADMKIPANKGKKGKKKFGSTASPGEGVTGEHTVSVPAHREPDGDAVEALETDMGLPHNGGEEMKAAWRLKSAGAPRDLGVLHDLSCPAFAWDDVMKVHPDASFATIDVPALQAKAMDAAFTSTRDEAEKVGRLWQYAVALKSADASLLHAVRDGLHKAFQDANPGPGKFPAPSEISATRYRRPLITEGHDAPSPGHEGPNTARVPADGIGASDYHRDYLSAGHAAETPGGSPARPLSTPHTPGVPDRADYSMLKESNVRQAMLALHDHVAQTFPDLCPMDSIQVGGPAPVASPVAHKQERGGDSSDPGQGGDQPAFPGAAARFGKKKPGKKVKKEAALLASRRKALDKQLATLQRQAGGSKILAGKLAALEGRLATLQRQARKSPASAQLAAEVRQTREELAALLKSQAEAVPASAELASELRRSHRKLARKFDAAPAASAELTTELRRSRKELARKLKVQQKMLNGLAAAAAAGMPGPDLAPLQAASAQLAAELRQSRKQFARFKAERKQLEKAEAAVAVVPPAEAATSSPSAARELRRAGTRISKGNARLAAQLRAERKQLDKKFKAQHRMLTALAERTVTDPGQLAQAGDQVQQASKSLAKELRRTRTEFNGKLRAQRRQLDTLASQPDVAMLVKAASADVRRVSEESAADMRRASEESIAAARRAAEKSASAARKAADTTIADVRSALMQVLQSPALTRGQQPPFLPPLPQQTAKETRKVIREELAAIAKSQEKDRRAQEKKVRKLTKQIDTIAGQPDMTMAAWKGGVAPTAFKNVQPGSPAGNSAGDAARTQNMMLQELEKQFRASPDPAQREAAWKAITKMRGIPE